MRDRWTAGTLERRNAFLRLLRRVFGMPDYEGYLEHLRRSHPDRQVPTEREFYEEFVRCRYGDGATRCC